MTNCKNCGAALPEHTLVCSYCKTRQDVDLGEIHRYTTAAPESKRFCPRCRKPLETINLAAGDKFFIERCDTCLGLFFDPGELEALVDKSVAHVYEIDHGRLEDINRVKRSDEYPVSYIECPACRKLMNRLNFGSRSGVIIDRCRDHGIWLDGGELRRILEWVKAGGGIFDKQKQLEMERLELEQERKNLQFKTIENASIRTSGFPEPDDSGRGFDLLKLIGRILGAVVR